MYTTVKMYSYSVTVILFIEFLFSIVYYFLHKIRYNCKLQISIETVLMNININRAQIQTLLPQVVNV